MIPAGLGHRVNTFFSQARNSLAGARVAEREEGRKGGETENEKEQKEEMEYNNDRMVWGKKLYLVIYM